MGGWSELSLCPNTLMNKKRRLTFHSVSVSPNSPKSSMAHGSNSFLVATNTPRILESLVQVKLEMQWFTGLHIRSRRY